MAKVVALQSDFIRRNLIERLKDYGISRISHDRYVDDLSIDELQIELKKVTHNEKNNILGTSKRRFRNNDKQGIAIALSSINWLEGEV